MITELEFKSLASEGYNRIPLMVEAFADLETPLSLYLKLAHTKDGGKHSFLLESVVGGERFGRYSFIGLPARTLLRASGFGADARTEVVTDGQVVETAAGNPLDFIAEYQKRFKVALRPGLPRFCGGLAGYFGYDAVRYIEKKLQHSCPPDELGTPDILLLQCEELAVIDNLSGKLHLMVYVDPATPEAFARGNARLAELKGRLASAVSAPVVKPTQGHAAQRDFAKADYIAAPTCITTSSVGPTVRTATSMWWGHPPKFWFGKSKSPWTPRLPPKSPSARWPEPVRVAPRPNWTRLPSRS